MGYKMPIVCKKIVLPAEEADERLTLKQYQEKYGIDLTKIFDFVLPVNEGDPLIVQIKEKKSLLYAYLSVGFAASSPDLLPITEIKEESVWNPSESKNGIVTLGSYNSQEGAILGIRFVIKSSVSVPTLEDIVISFIEI